MNNPKRVAAGRLGIGVPRRFSADELAKRSERLAAVRHLAVAAMARKRREAKERIESQKALVKAAASARVFVPVQSFE